MAPMEAKTQRADRQLLFSVEERKTVGNVYDGGTESPIMAGFVIMASAIQEAGQFDAIELTFTFQGNVYRASARPTS